MLTHEHEPVGMPGIQLSLKILRLNKRVRLLDLQPKAGQEQPQVCSPASLRPATPPQRSPNLLPVRLRLNAHEANRLTTPQDLRDAFA